MLGVAALCCLTGPVRAQSQSMPGVVLELDFTPAPRAQLAVWLEDASGHFIRTLQLTEAVAFHGIGNRPGASELNSGYRWPYGRREGVLPIWASRRAAAPGAKQWKRVIFQNRTSEGLASRTSTDQSPDDYFCLSFNQAKSSRDALDAMSCASPTTFSSDKGRFITDADVAAGYAEPWQDPSTQAASMQPLSLFSLYPPRMDVTRCTDSSCYDTQDVSGYAAHAREVMPEIDAVSIATLPGNTAQSLLYSLPPDWPQGQYALWLEIAVEGDYDATYDATTLPTPSMPSGKWDSWAMTFGYPYRGQPSIAFEVPFELGAPGEAVYTTAAPVGRSSWDVWSQGYGALQSLDGIADDPAGAPGSGADRLRADASGQRITLHVRTLAELAPPDPNHPFPTLPTGSHDGAGSGGGDTTSPSSPADGGMAGAGGASATEADAGASAGGAGPPAAQSQRDPQTDAVILLPQAAPEGPVGAIHGLRLGHHPDVLHSHEWITLRFLAASSEQPLHRYEVRVSEEPITDEASFIQNGRAARTATADAEGAVLLMLPTDVAAGQLIESAIGGLVALTHYYVAVRATDELDRHGPISVAEISTTKRSFATVTPCFVASAAYGTPLAAQVGVLRRMRDRQLLSNAPGRALVHAYYAHGAAAARVLQRHPTLRHAVRWLLEPLVSALHRLER